VRLRNVADVRFTFGRYFAEPSQSDMRITQGRLGAITMSALCQKRTSETKEAVS
jgi:hypothetical protein